MSIQFKLLFSVISIFLVSGLYGQTGADAGAPVKPQVFLSGLVSTGMNERDITLSPDGNELFFTATTPNQQQSCIFYSKKTKNAWSKPEKASFSGIHPDLEPMFSPDGQTLYYASRRRDSVHLPLQADIYIVKRTEKGWSKEEKLPFNTSVDEYFPSVNRAGDIFFTGIYDMDATGENIYVARKTETGYAAPQKLSEAINSTNHEFNAFMHPDENFIIFTRFGQKGDKGGGDLYISYQNNGTWSEALPLESANSSALDYCPFVDIQTNTLYFTSRRSLLQNALRQFGTLYESYQDSYLNPGNGQGDIYWMVLPSVAKKK